jgi:hypothetical protein
LRGLLAGEYFLVALPASEAAASFDLSWFDRLEPFAQRLTIGDGEVQRVRLRAARVLDRP